MCGLIVGVEDLLHFRKALPEQGRGNRLLSQKDTDIVRTTREVRWRSASLSSLDGPRGESMETFPTILPGQPTQTQISELVRPRVLTLGFLGGRVYSCPYCPLQGLTDMRLVQHCVGSHTGENAPAVCPICAATVWGNASYCSRNLIGHLAIRHYFSYDTYMNVGEDDYTQLCLAIQQSLRQGTGITE
uniref:Di19 zinc-binding domain-containing protein n=1 Tax=Oncorhynchus tshawytscha TaxID=74940 RepID=A0AAZ3REP0_ONCTS